MSTQPKSNRKIWFFIISAICLAACYLHKAAPYIFVVNSVPGQRALDDVEQLHILTNMDRIKLFSERDRRQVLEEFAATDFSELGSAYRRQSMSTLRTVLANFELNENIEACNDLLKNMYVWGNSGSQWKANPKGDYDFTTIWMIRLLYEFGNKDVFFPDTLDYFLDTLLNLDGKPVLTVPRSLGTVFDTENHLLMREGSRYLKNQWMAEHGNKSRRYNNQNNGMEEWMVRYLNSLRQDGVYEYNSMPYVTYTILPLLNLADYATSIDVKMLATSILDSICKRYAYGSLNWMQCTSFRRQPKFANSNRLNLNPIELPLRFWAGMGYSQEDLRDERGQILLAMVFSRYKPAQQTMDILLHKPADYFAVFGHPQKGAPEIYSGSADFLLSAGGAYTGLSGKVIARPIALLLPDQGRLLSDTIRIEGDGDWETWNMTGVHQRLAVAKGRIIIPDIFNISLPFNQWTVFKATNALMIAAYQAEKLGLLVLFPTLEYSKDKMQELLHTTNPSPDKKNEFIWPENIGPPGINKVSFDVTPEKGVWVIKSINDEIAGPLKTRYWEHWPKELIQYLLGE